MKNGIIRGVAQSGSAPALGAGGRWFESSHPDYEEEENDDMSIWPSVEAVMFAHAVVARLGRTAKVLGASDDARAYYEAAQRMERHLLERVPEIEQAGQEGRLTGIPEKVN